MTTVPKKDPKPILPVEQRRHLHGKIAFAIQFGLAEVPIGIEALKSADRYIQDLEAQCSVLRATVLLLAEKIGKNAGADLTRQVETAMSGEAGATLAEKMSVYENALRLYAENLAGKPEGEIAREALKWTRNGKSGGTP